MTLSEVLTELKAQKKIYHQVGMKQSYFSDMIKRIENGMCRPETINNFLSKFGYIVEINESWSKSLEIFDAKDAQPPHNAVVFVFDKNGIKREGRALYKETIKPPVIIPGYEFTGLWYVIDPDNIFKEVLTWMYK